jgi:hypothetical protein
VNRRINRDIAVDGDDTPLIKHASQDLMVAAIL